MRGEGRGVGEGGVEACGCCVEGEGQGGGGAWRCCPGGSAEDWDCAGTAEDWSPPSLLLPSPHLSSFPRDLF